MFRIIQKSIHSFATISKPHTSSFSTSPTKSVNEESFSVGYLINQFGFSQEKAVLASSDSRVNFKNPNKPDAVVSFFKNQGFTHTQIQKVIYVQTRILMAKPEKTLLPKIDFFKSKGASAKDLAKILMYDPTLLLMSLEGKIAPAFKFFSDFLGSEQCVIQMLTRNSRLFNALERRVKPNIETLSQAGVPQDNIGYLMRNQPRVFLYGSDELKESIEELRKLGMDPECCSYSLAMSILTMTPMSKWNEKMEAYKRWGCSEEEVLATFKIFPWIMSLSVAKIDGVMSFCVDEMGWKPSKVMRKYFVFTLSLNKRLVPRWSVYQELVSKGLVKGECRVRKLFTMKEDLFVEQYVIPYMDEAPFLLKLYLDKLGASK